MSMARVAVERHVVQRPAALGADAAENLVMNFAVAMRPDVARRASTAG